VAGNPADVSLVPENALLKLVNRTTTGAKNNATVNRRSGSDIIVVSGAVSKEGVLGPVTIRDPGLHFGHVLKRTLLSEDIPVLGDVVRRTVRHADGSLPVDCHVVAVHGAPLRNALSRAGKQSVGMMAEALIKLLGREVSGVGSWDEGRRAVAKFLRRADAPEEQVTVDDGSGLSRANRLSAAAVTKVLQHMISRDGAAFELLRDSLACAGVDGTMKKRCRWPETKGKVFAKTGYIRGVRTLAGYIQTGSDRWLAFAFLHNNSPNPAALKKLQDRACRLLARYTPDQPSPG
jgi:D-alanyl-D-alanine carboxypeptidase/D-alanyl-D-alanine-endopeptidase (penicillin-binding protein 4)